MTTSEPQPHDRSGDESHATTNATGSDDDSEVAAHDRCHETVDADTRNDVLKRDLYQCRTCGRGGPEVGGLATLHVHHIQRDPDGMDEHDLQNLTTLCRQCHSWHHQRMTEDDAPVELSEADLSVLLPQDIEILQHLADNGPARTGNIATALNADLSVNAIRERLWVLMGLDNIVSSRDRQIVDKDIETGEWGLTDQVGTSARGHIPDDPQLLLQRMEDEQVRRALERGCDRTKITEVLDISRRTTFYKAKRANAYDFPLDAFGRGGRPSDVSDESSATTEAAPDATDDEQQRLDTVADDESEPGSKTETWGSGSPDSNTVSEEQSDTDHSLTGDADEDTVRQQLQAVIDVLQRVDAQL